MTKSKTPATLHEGIVDRVREMILEGALVPGEGIAEIKLCADLGISRTPLREALKVLATEKLVRLVQNRGAIVAEIAVAEIADLFEIMEPMEELVGQLAAAKMTEADLAGIESLHAQMVSAGANARRQEYFAVNQSIHLRLAELAGNPTLAATYANFARRIRRARYLANMSEARWRESMREHEQFMVALRQRDAGRFGAMLREHSRNTGVFVCNALRTLNAKHAKPVKEAKTRDDSQRRSAAR